jgi:hypothetical protein
VKRLQCLLLLLFLAVAAGCEHDVREPGEPRIQMTPLAAQTSAATRSSAAARGLAYGWPNKWTWFSSE